MAVTTAIARAVSNLATGNQDITDASFGGGTPKACIVLWSEAVTVDVAVAGARSSYGMASGVSNQGCQSFNSDDGDAVASDTRSELVFDQIIRINQFGSSTQEGSAAFVSFITNGIRINWTDAPPVAGLITVALFGGADFQAHVDNYALGAISSVVDTTAPGFQPNVVLSMSVHADGGGSWRIGTGIAWDDAGIIQHTSADHHNNSSDPTDVSQSIFGSIGAGLKLRTTAAEQWGLTFSDFDANGFTTTLSGLAASGASHFYMAMDFGPNEVFFGPYVTPASTGDDVEVLGFKPQLVFLFILEEVTAFDTQTRGGTEGISVFNEASEFCQSSSDEDGLVPPSTPTNTQSLSSAKALDVPDGAGTLESVATLAQFDAAGYTLNYTTVPSTQRAYLQLAIEEDAAVAAPGAAVLTGVGDLVAVGTDRLPGAASLTGIGNIVAFGNTVPQATLTGVGLIKARGVDANAEGGAGIILRHRGGLGEMSGIVQRREFIRLTSGAAEVVSAPFHLGGNSWEVKFKTAAALNGVEGSHDLEDWDVMTDLFNIPIEDRNAGTIVGLERPKWLRTVVAIDASQPREFSSIISVQKQQGS